MKRILTRSLAAVAVFTLLFAGTLAVPGMSDVAPVETGVAEAQNCPPTLAEGSAGQWVRELQYALNQYPYEVIPEPLLEIDGDFGPLTEDAVIHFQTYYGLQVDGIVGPQTWGQLGYCF